MYTVQIYCSLAPFITITDDVQAYLKRQRLSLNDDIPKTLVFDSREALYSFVRGFDYTGYYEKHGNRFLDATMCSVNESRRHKQSFETHYRYCWRPFNYVSELEGCYYLGYLTRDSRGRVIDLRNYSNELYEFDKNSYEDIQKLARRQHWETRYAILNDKWEKAKRLYEGKDYWAYYRRIRTTQERRCAANPEHKPFVRGRRSFENLPNSWDDFYFCREKNWKARDKKARWHWEVKLPKHIGTISQLPSWDAELFEEIFD